VIPDAPVETFALEMQGGAKGLLVNSTDICAHAHRAIADFTGQDGKFSHTEPLLKISCKKKTKKGRRHRKKT
jgi:hypothetical protein